MLQENLDLIINKAKKIFKNTETVENQNNQMQQKIHEIITSSIKEDNHKKENKFIEFYKKCNEFIDV